MFFCRVVWMKIMAHNLTQLTHVLYLCALCCAMAESSMSLPQNSLSSLFSCEEAHRIWNIERTTDTFNKCLLAAAAAVAASFEQMLTLFNNFFFILFSLISCLSCMPMYLSSLSSSPFCFCFSHFLIFSFIQPSAIQRATHNHCCARLRKAYLYHFRFSRIMNLWWGRFASSWN